MSEIDEHSEVLTHVDRLEPPTHAFEAREPGANSF